MEQDGQGVQKVIIAAFKYVYNTDQAATHVAAHLHLHRNVCSMSLSRITLFVLHTQN